MTRFVQGQGHSGISIVVIFKISMDLAVEKVLQNCYSRVAKMMQRGTICMHKFEDT